MSEPCCCVPECERPARRAGMCWSHSKRYYATESASASVPVRSYYRDGGLTRLMVAAIEYADADAEDDREYHLARERLRYAAYHYVRRSCS